jgi:hypothetical protein
MIVDFVKIFFDSFKDFFTSEWPGIYGDILWGPVNREGDVGEVWNDSDNLLVIWESPTQENIYPNERGLK